MATRKFIVMENNRIEGATGFHIVTYDVRESANPNLQPFAVTLYQCTNRAFCDFCDSVRGTASTNCCHVGAVKRFIKNKK